MKVLIFITLFVSIHVLGTSSPNDLIDFDKNSAKKYLKKHKVLSAYLVEEYNFGEAGNPPGYIWLYDASTNFTNLKVEKKFGLYIKIESWTFKWLKENKDLRVHFIMNEQTGIPELIGYSKKRISFKIRKNHIVDEEIELVDYSNVDTSNINIGDYIVGSFIDLDAAAIFPHLFKKEILLIYPFDLKEGKTTINSYGDRYSLSKPISENMLKAILSHSKLVLKKGNNGYIISGYLR